jgi:hypothetical protein
MLGKILLNVFYFFFVLPLGWLTHFFFDPLNIKRQPLITNWSSRSATIQSLEAMRRQI